MARSPDPLRLVRTVRYAVGTTLAVALAMGIDWRLSYLTPVLVVSFLGPPARRPSATTMVGVVVVVAAAATVGVVISAVLPYPAVFLLVQGLILFLLFCRQDRGAPAMVIALLMIAVTVIPTLALESMELAVAAAQGLVVAAAVAMVVVGVAYGLIADPATGEERPAVAKEAPGKSVQPQRASSIARARTSTLVVFPIVALYLSMGMTSVLVLVFVALLSMQADVAAGLKAGKALIVANVMGGLSGMLVFELLVMVPEYVFLLLLILLAAMWFGGRLFSETSTAPLFGKALATMLLVVLSATSQYGEADAKAWSRVVQLIIAVVYMVLAHAAVRTLGRTPEITHATT